MRRSALLPVAILLAGSFAACSTSTPSTGPNHQIAYAVLYGHVSAPAQTIQITVGGVAYTDSLKALAQDNSAYFGGISSGVDSLGDYTLFINPADGNPRTLWVNMLATGQGHTGYLSSTDTVRALRVHLDTLGGAPHDSLPVSFTLP
jgi:hypothetical protein